MYYIYKDSGLEFQVDTVFEMTTTQVAEVNTQLDQMFSDKPRPSSVDAKFLHIKDQSCVFRLEQYEGVWDQYEMAAFVEPLTLGFYREDRTEYPVLKSVLQINWLSDLLNNYAVWGVDPWPRERIEKEVFTIPEVLRIAGFPLNDSRLETFAREVLEKVMLRPIQQDEKAELRENFVEQKMLA